MGAGYTGLWTAHYLIEADPSLRIVVLEAETAGYGASGRNGGWCSALFPASGETLAGLPGASPDAARAQLAAMRESVIEVGRAAAGLGIDADYVQGGSIVLARSGPQWQRARKAVAEAAWWGDDLALLDAAEAGTRLRGSRTRGATYTTHCARLHPAKLVRGLAASVEARGVRIFEGTRVSAIEPGKAVTDHGTVRADVVVRATEGYTAGLAGQRRTLAPVHSQIVATEPLPAAVWDEIGLAGRETFSDYRNLIVYGQRTADDRLIFGGRGAAYRLRSRVVPVFDPGDGVFAGLHESLLDLFPVLAGVRFTHAWGGALGVPRDWVSGVGLDRGAGLAWAGGYVGDGVATSNLAGRTLRDLILAPDGEETALTRLPWVGHRSPAWEPEPLRWLGINGGRIVTDLADAEERLTGRESILARAMAPFLG